MYNPYFHILEKNPCKNKIKLVFDLILFFICYYLLK